jgi:1-acyl-sn-glycerol-3-phosphate acyltransferase
MTSPSEKTTAAQRTLFNTPLLTALLRGVSHFILAVRGWRTQGSLPDTPKYVMIAAPHTSNWDLPIMLMMAFVMRADVFWMGKHTLFRGVFGPFFRWLGGVPVDRRKSGNLVEQTVEVFRQRDRFALVIAPEGTRKLASHWKTGFYHIARGAGVPIVLGFIDYRHKVGGVGPVITPSGDLEHDMAEIREFYADITGKYSAESTLAHVESKT